VKGDTVGVCSSKGRYCRRMFQESGVNQVIFHFWDILRDYVPLLGHWQQLRSMGEYNFHFWDITDYTHSSQGIQPFCIPNVGGMELLCPTPALCSLNGRYAAMLWQWERPVAQWWELGLVPHTFHLWYITSKFGRQRILTFRTWETTLRYVPNMEDSTTISS